MSHQIGTKKGLGALQIKEQTIVIFHPTSRLAVTTMALHKLLGKEQHFVVAKSVSFSKRMFTEQREKNQSSIISLESTFNQITTSKRTSFSYRETLCDFHFSKPKVHTNRFHNPPAKDDIPIFLGTVLYAYKMYFESFIAHKSHAMNENKVRNASLFNSVSAQIRRGVRVSHSCVCMVVSTFVVCANPMMKTHNCKGCYECTYEIGNISSLLLHLSTYFFHIQLGHINWDCI